MTIAVVDSNTSKCLNDTRRALTLKLGATALLATWDLVGSLSVVLTNQQVSVRISEPWPEL